MSRQEGSTIVELLAILAILAVFAGVAVPGASRARASVAAAEGARRLALVLRVAQAEAQSRGGRVLVSVATDGDFSVIGADGEQTHGSLGASVTSTYPGNAIEFTRWGWACLPGLSSPRAGHFGIAGAATSATVVVQLSGCVRCT